MFSINKTYKFTTLAPSILGASYELMKVKSIMSSEEAVKYRDVNTVNAQLSSIINGLSSNADDLTYILFETVNKEKVVFANEWINQDTIEGIGSTNIRIDLPNRTTADIEIAKRALLELGYTDLIAYTY